MEFRLIEPTTNTHVTMNLQPHIKRTLASGLLIVAALLLSLRGQAQPFVAFKGQVLAEGNALARTTITVLDSSASMDVVIRRDGRYEFFIPVDHVVQVVVMAPGHTTRTITIDTHDAPRAQAMNDVAYMMPMDLRLGKPATDPPAIESAGRIGFEPGTSRCIVQRPQEFVEDAPWTMAYVD